MKKIITIIAIAIIALTSTFAVVTTNKISFNGNIVNALQINIILKSSLEPTNYDLSLLYNEDSFKLEDSTSIYGYDLTKKGRTNDFHVMISNGNLNKTITFVTVITEKPFVGLIDGIDYITNSNLRVLNNNDENQTIFSTKIIAGPQAQQSVATFYFNWDADEELPAGDYATTNTIIISVN